MLRRLKESVASELPAKSEVVLRAAMGPYQAALMRLVRCGFEAGAGAAGGSGGGSGASGATALNRAVNNTVMEMRNICNHPYIRCADLGWSVDCGVLAVQQSNRCPGMQYLSRAVIMRAHHAQSLRHCCTSFKEGTTAIPRRQLPLATRPQC